MTQVIFPPLANPAAGPARIGVRLVNANGQPVAGFRISNPATIIAPFEFLLGADPVTVDLAPQSDIATAGAVATWYQIQIPRGRPGEQPRFQVPVSPTPVQIADLVGTSGIAPGDVLVGRLLPDPSGVPDGSTLVVHGGTAGYAEPTGDDIDPDLNLIYSIAKL